MMRLVIHGRPPCALIAVLSPVAPTSVVAVAALMVAALGLVSSGALAQQGTRPRAEGAGAQTIIIRGQVPTPQVITVRPRHVPDYGSEVRGSEQHDRSFWSSLLPAYQLVPRRQVMERSPLDSSAAAEAGEATAGMGGAAAAAAREGVNAANAEAIDSLRREIVERRARLDSLERAARGERALETMVRERRVPSRTSLSPADSIARAREIDALLTELKYHSARLDSLEAVVRSLGRPRAPADTVPTPNDSSSPAGLSTFPLRTSSEDPLR